MKFIGIIKIYDGISHLDHFCDPKADQMIALLIGI
jgi:hypothetical protein